MPHALGRRELLELTAVGVCDAGEGYGSVGYPEFQEVDPAIELVAAGTALISCLVVERRPIDVRQVFSIAAQKKFPKAIGPSGGLCQAVSDHYREVLNIDRDPVPGSPEKLLPAPPQSGEFELA